MLHVFSKASNIHSTPALHYFQVSLLSIGRNCNKRYKLSVFQTVLASRSKVWQETSPRSVFNFHILCKRDRLSLSHKTSLQLRNVTFSANITAGRVAVSRIKIQQGLSSVQQCHRSSSNVAIDPDIRKLYETRFGKVWKLTMKVVGVKLNDLRLKPWRL